MIQLSKAIRNYLDVASHHLPHTEWTAMAEVFRREGVPLCEHSYGRWVQVFAASDAHIWSALLAACPVLCRIMEVAAEQGCGWINFDSDAQPIEDFEVYPYGKREKADAHQ